VFLDIDRSLGGKNRRLQIETDGCCVIIGTIGAVGLFQQFFNISIAFQDFVVDACPLAGKQPGIQAGQKIHMVLQAAFGPFMFAGNGELEVRDGVGGGQLAIVGTAHILTDILRYLLQDVLVRKQPCIVCHRCTPLSDKCHLVASCLGAVHPGGKTFHLGTHQVGQRRAG